MTLRFTKTLALRARRRACAGLGAAASLLLTAACTAQAAPPLHWPVDPPPAVGARQPRLWVALAPRLGSEPAAPPLVLQAAKGTLQLQDAAGRRVSAATIALGWQQVPLQQPLQLERLVAGPFASFETAEARAEQWRALGVSVSVAQPREWELWAPLASPLPAGWTARPFRARLHQVLEPRLLRPRQDPGRLQGPLLIEAPGGLRWRGATYRGPFRLQRDAHGSWTLVEQVPLERYLEGVVPHEIGAGAPAAALAAQTVLARTWALRNQHRYRTDGYHLCASVQCQVYSDPALANAAVRAAIGSTSGLLLTWQQEPIHAVYHATNGGVAAPLDEAWDAQPLPYLRAGLDAQPPRPLLLPLPPSPLALAPLLASRAFVGADHPRFRWTRELDRQQVAAALVRQGIRVGEVERLQVLERGSSGRVLALAIEGSGGRTVLRRDAIRRTLRTLPSTLFELRQQSPGRWVVRGGGFGHGVGLSQAGAIALGRMGWTYQAILERYYPGTRLQSLASLAASDPGGDP
ncbi:MAG: SpoIID/LytB domain-containing protein [Cyanobacteriota bacterium]|nr:SpoIID/LytB domain-containing protein [Cyanobacteriota bacterium]